MNLILSVLKPFGDLSHEKQLLSSSAQQQTTIGSGLSNRKKSTTHLPYFYENMLKHQCEGVNIATLLNPYLSIMPFKSYFEPLYKLSEVFIKLDTLIENYDELKATTIMHHFFKLVNQTNALFESTNSRQQSMEQQLYRTHNERTQTSSTVTFESKEALSEQLTSTTTKKSSKEESEDSSSLNRFNLNSLSSSQFPSSSAAATSAVTSTENAIDTDMSKESLSYYEEQAVRLDSLHEQKFYIGSCYIPALMIDMSDPKKNQLIHSIAFTNDCFDLILPRIMGLFENPFTSLNSFLYLFNKLSRFLSFNELTRRFLPLILHVLNAVDLSETNGIDLSREEEKLKLCKIFDYQFINELRIIFGLRIFLTQICPFLIEAISGFKDFDQDSGCAASNDISSTKENVSNQAEQQQQQKQQHEKRSNGKKRTLTKEQALDPIASTGAMGGAIFDMESFNSVNASYPVNELKSVDEHNEQHLSPSSSKHSLNSSRETIEISPSNDSSKQQQQQRYGQAIDLLDNAPITKPNRPSSVSGASEYDRTSLTSQKTTGHQASINQVKQASISQTAFGTFCKIVELLGPVLTCKYLCTDLFKMLAICYMNSRCLNPIENLGK
jgi:hypothetical protein